ncbi:MAG: response regulator [Planctomycetes bacterium]|nr:response regulator [Planctomycetota bacterium]
MPRKRVTVVEDEADIREVIEYNLARDGYEVTSVPDGEEGLKKIRKDSPDLVVLDLMLPGLDGIEVCRKLKADSVTTAIPIIMLTAKGEESDVVLGLGVGADDYITKPFSPAELLARVRAVLRRGPLKEAQVSKERIVRQGVVIDAARHETKVNGESVPFTATEFRLLHFLASHPGRVFTRDHLLSRVVGENVVVIDRNIDVHIRSIRMKLANHRNLVETVRGIGYRFQDTED